MHLRPLQEQTTIAKPVSMARGAGNDRVFIRAGPVQKGSVPLYGRSMKENFGRKSAISSRMLIGRDEQEIRARLSQIVSY